MRSFRSALVHSAQRFSHCKRRLCSAAAIGALLTPSLLTAQAADPLAGKVGRTVQETHAPTWPSQPQAPKGAPNVLVILTDDIGFGVSSAFGGPSNMNASICTPGKQGHRPGLASDAGSPSTTTSGPMPPIAVNRPPWSTSTALKPASRCRK